MHPGVHILFYIFSYDIGFYLSHLLHDPTIYRNLHKQHHSLDYRHIQWLDTYYGHYLESIIQCTGIFIPWIYITSNLHEFVISILLINIRGMLRHHHRYIWLMGNHHILHHKYPQYNFGEYWLDHLLGTLCPHTDEYHTGLIYR